MRRLDLLWLIVGVFILAACGPSGGADPCQLSGAISGEVTLSPSVCNPYHVSGDVSVGEGGKLTIEPGTTLEFAQDTGISVSGHGALVAVGSATDKITFTGASQVRGYWDGISFNAANSFDNELKYVEIKYAGGEQRWDSGAFEHYRAALDLQSDSRLKMTHSTISESAGSGLFLDDQVIIGTDNSPDGDFAGNTITSCASYPVITYANEVGFLDGSNDFAGNDAGYDYVRFSGDYVYIATQTWQNLNVPYLVKDQPGVGAGEVLTIAPGTKLVFEQDAGLEAYGSNSAIKAIGTSAERITFTGKQQTNGYWAGLHFNDTNNSNNILRYVIVEYGGNNTGFLDSDALGNVVVSSSGNSSHQTIEVSHSIIRHSGHWGISVAHETTDTISNVTYSDNANGNYQKRP